MFLKLKGNRIKALEKYKLWRAAKSSLIFGSFAVFP